MHREFTHLVVDADDAAPRNALLLQLAPRRRVQRELAADFEKRNGKHLLGLRQYSEERQLVRLQARCRHGCIAEYGLWRRVGLRNPEQENAAVEVLLGGRHAGAQFLLLIEVEAAFVRQPFGCRADDVRAGSVARGTKHLAARRVEYG